MVLAEVEVRDDRGILIAHGSSLYITLAGGSYRAPAQTPVPDGDGSGPDPWERELDPAASSPIGLLTGLAPVTAADGRATFALPASPWLCAPPPGRVQGGMVAMLAEAAIESALQTEAPCRTTYAPADLKVNYLRPLASDGREARAEARAVHAGRRIAVATAEVTDADGRSVAVATGSGLFVAAPWMRPSAASAALAATLVVIGLAIAVTGCGSSGTEAGTVQRTASPVIHLSGRGPAHIAVVLMENEEYGDIIGSRSTPYINGLAHRYALATVDVCDHASIAAELPGPHRRLDLRHRQRLHRLLGVVHRISPTSCRGPGSPGRPTWRTSPARAFTGASAPASTPRNTTRSCTTDGDRAQPAHCSRVVSLSALGADERAARLPAFIWITPNLCHDMHDCRPAVGDRFSLALVPPLLRALGPRGLLFLTWDEGTSDDGCCRLASRRSHRHDRRRTGGPAARPPEYARSTTTRCCRPSRICSACPGCAAPACPCTPSLSPLLVGASTRWGGQVTTG